MRDPSSPEIRALLAEHFPNEPAIGAIIVDVLAMLARLAELSKREPQRASDIGGLLLMHLRCYGDAIATAERDARNNSRPEGD